VTPAHNLYRLINHLTFRLCLPSSPSFSHSFSLCCSWALYLLLSLSLFRRESCFFPLPSLLPSLPHSLLRALPLWSLCFSRSFSRSLSHTLSLPSSLSPSLSFFHPLPLTKMRLYVCFAFYKLPLNRQPHVRHSIQSAQHFAIGVLSSRPATCPWKNKFCFLLRVSQSWSPSSYHACLYISRRVS